jgi:hypothetical protein
VLALLFAADAALISFDLVPYFGGIRWLRIHPITLGIVTETTFGLLPGLVAARAGRPRPKARLDQWLLLTVGILVLLAGIPLINGALILTGGSLIFVASALLAHQLWQLGAAGSSAETDAGEPEAGSAAVSGRPFYIMALLYLLLGIVIGTGMWIGWGPLMRMKIPLEVHIHANNWGFASLLFAGLLVDLYPRFAGRPFHWPGAPRLILWAMSLGALGLVLGPWTGLAYFTVPGIVLHLGATLALLLNVVLPLRGDPLGRSPGVAMLVVAYFWILLPVMFAPLILTGVGNLDAAGIEANAPQALIYGWVFQFAFAIVPFLFRRALAGEAVGSPADTPGSRALGGSWAAFAALNVGAILLWASIFAGDSLAGPLHGAAYVLWTLAAAAFAWEMVGVMRAGLSAQPA